LPFWYEDQREAILATLEPVMVPEANRPRSGAVPVAHAQPRATAAIPLSRTNADFRTGARAHFEH
jgi:hypothetical protein